VNDRLDLKSLMRAAGCEAHIHLAELLGTYRDDVTRTARTGLHPIKADAWAVKLGLHPYEVWGERWHEVELFCRTFEPVPRRRGRPPRGNVCKAGHLIAGENVMMNSGRAICRQCRLAQMRAQKARRRKERQYQATVPDARA
jgi:hypothetical protein